MVLFAYYYYRSHRCGAGKLGACGRVSLSCTAIDRIGWVGYVHQGFDRGFSIVPAFMINMLAPVVDNTFYYIPITFRTRVAVNFFCSVISQLVTSYCQINMF